HADAGDRCVRCGARDPRRRAGTALKPALAAALARHWADPLYRQSYLMLASTGVSAGTGLLFWVFAALTVRPDVLGVAARLVAANAFLSYLTSFALPYAMLRYGARLTGLAVNACI